MLFHGLAKRRAALAATLGLLLAAGIGAPYAYSAANSETIVLVRHGEKPSTGLGQLTCQGLNRALKLPGVLKRYGRPDAIFAPNPSVEVSDHGKLYDYVRPLATIEPTAIALGMPVNTRYGYNDIDRLQKDLLGDHFKDKLVFVAWEHVKLNDLTKSILQQVHSTATVPDWPDGEYDRIYVLTVFRNGSNVTGVKFQQDKEGLNNQPTQCP